MSKRITLCALICALLLLAGCSDDFTIEEPTEAPIGVDIVVPFATSTPAAEERVYEDALHISRDGKVQLNDGNILDENIAGSGSYGLESQYTQLVRGSASSDVTALQNRLAYLGYYTGEITGIYDESTEQAVKLFEAAFGITRTGIATATLQERLFSDDALFYGSDAYNESVYSFYTRIEENDTGSAVLSLQNRLKELGYYEGEVTGVFDDNTIAAVGRFYRMYGKKARTYAGPELQKALYDPDAPMYDPDKKYVAPTKAPEADPYDYSLSLGNSGTRVSQLQTRLCALGYLDEVTGAFDQKTVEAVSAFQSAIRVESTGVATEDVQQVLFSNSAPVYGTRLDIYRTLQWGDSGDYVTKLQKRLIELGYMSAIATGIFDDETAKAVSLFQTAVGEEATGSASPALQETLYSADAPESDMLAVRRSEDEAATNYVYNELKKGDSGEGVVLLQQRLIELNYYDGSADGAFGGGTESAVKRLQRNLGVEADGKANADFLNILFSNAAPPNGTNLSSGEYETLQEGDVSKSVASLQKRLYQLGFLSKEDIEPYVGTYESITADAVNSAMKAVGCELRDGRCTAMFQAYLFSELSEQISQR